MQEIIRQYGKAIIAVAVCAVITAVFTTAALFPQYGLLSWLGTKSQIEADHMDGDYMVSVSEDEGGSSITTVLYENQDINFEFVTMPHTGEVFHINYNKAKSVYLDSSLIRTDRDNATITIASVKNNDDEDAFTTLAKDSEGNIMDVYQVEYNYYNYLNELDSLENYALDDGTIVFNEAGVYSITVEAKWDNGNGGGYSVRQKIFKVRVFEDDAYIIPN